ncbi:MAG: DUF4203 domain-containing protein [Acidobacteria bacterium]|nr:DUF4203 domain-containing protein [Acidobacteriota bacterium]
MPSVSLQLPVAVILLGGGLVATLAGYRLLRALLALYGFVAGIIITPLIAGDLAAWELIAATVAGGLVGAGLAIGFYLAGVAVLGAGLAAFILNLAMEGDPDVRVLLATSVGGALVMLLVRHYVLIAATAFLGGWTAIVGGMALAGNEAAVTATTGDVTQLFPMVPIDGHAPFAIGWLVLGLCGALVQLRTRSRVRARKAARS